MEEIGFELLYRQYEGLVRSILLKLCGPRELEDLVQETFFKIWKGLEGFRGECSMKTWVAKIAHRSAVSHLRARRPNLEATGDAPSGESDPTEGLMLKAALEALSSDHRAALVLHCLEGMSVQEIANQFDIPAGTVKSRLFHARAKLGKGLSIRQMRKV